MTAEVPTLNESTLLQDKVIVVSGVGPGLGRSLALRGAQAGADVVLAARTESRLDSVAREVESLGRRALSVPTDLTDEVSVANLVAAGMDTFGHIDGVVHNAFVQGRQMSMLDMDLETVRNELDVNLLAALSLVREVAPYLVESRGSVVMVNSMVIRNRTPDVGGYRTAKAGLMGLARSLSIDLGPKGVRVNSVVPGYIWADRVKSHFEQMAADTGTPLEELLEQFTSRVDLRKLPEPDEIADAAVFLLSGMARAISGQCIDVNGGEEHY